MNINSIKKTQLFLLPLLLIMILSSPPLQAEEVTPVFPIDQSVKLDPKLKLPNYNFSLPVNATGLVKTHLSVKVPATMYTEKLYFENFIEDKSNAILEFVPRKQEFNDWREILTIHKVLNNNNISADQITKYLIDQIKGNTDYSKLIESNNTDYSAYSRSTTAILYQLNNGQHELIYVDYYSGPLDTAGIQYTVKLGKNPSQTEIKQALEKIKKGFSQSVYIITF